MYTYICMYKHINAYVSDSDYHPVARPGNAGTCVHLSLCVCICVCINIYM